MEPCVNCSFDTHAKGVVKATTNLSQGGCTPEPQLSDKLASEPYVAYLKHKLAEWSRVLP